MEALYLLSVPLSTKEHKVRGKGECGLLYVGSTIMYEDAGN